MPFEMSSSVSASGRPSVRIQPRALPRRATGSLDDDATSATKVPGRPAAAARAWHAASAPETPPQFGRYVVEVTNMRFRRGPLASGSAAVSFASIVLLGGGIASATPVGSGQGGA